MAPPGLLSVYRRLRRAHGHAGWWPAGTAFEVCVGAILTQNTAWSNVEKALARPPPVAACSRTARLRRVPLSRLGRLIRSSGVFRVKARRLRAFLDFLASRVWRSRRAHARARSPERPPAEAARRSRHRARDRRLDRPLRGRPAALRGGRLHAAHLHAARRARGRRELRRGPARLHGRAAPRRRPSTTTTTPRSCGSRRTPVACARVARPVPSTGCARSGEYDRRDEAFHAARRRQLLALAARRARLGPGFLEALGRRPGRAERLQAHPATLWREPGRLGGARLRHRGLLRLAAREGRPGQASARPTSIP